MFLVITLEYALQTRMEIQMASATTKLKSMKIITKRHFAKATAVASNSVLIVLWVAFAKLRKIVPNNPAFVEKSIEIVILIVVLDAKLA